MDEIRVIEDSELEKLFGKSMADYMSYSFGFVKWYVGKYLWKGIWWNRLSLKEVKVRMIEFENVREKATAKFAYVSEVRRRGVFRSGSVWLEVMAMLDRERYEREVLDEIRRLGIEFPNKKIVLVLDVDKKARMAVMEALNDDGEESKYLCSDVGYVEVHTVWNLVDTVMEVEFNCRDAEVVKKMMIERVLNEAFGGDDDE